MASDTSRARPAAEPSPSVTAAGMRPVEAPRPTQARFGSTPSASANAASATASPGLVSQSRCTTRHRVDPDTRPRASTPRTRRNPGADPDIRPRAHTARSRANHWATPDTGLRVPLPRPFRSLTSTHNKLI